ncbi:MAG: serine hydrolase domain-containing protein, partial [Gemmatimonadota bacterium]
MSRQHSFSVLSLASLLLIAGCAGFARVTPAYLDRIEAPTPLAGRIDSALTALERQGFAGTVLVARGTHMIVYRGYGVADASTGTRASALTRYPFGAVVNQFTAAAVLQLQSAGRLRASDRVGQFDREAGAELSGATLHELLTRSREPLEYATATGPAAPAAFRDNAPLLALPLQEQFRASGVSYAELEKVVAAVSGQPFADYRQQHILVPSRMDRTVDATWIGSADQVALGNSFGRETAIKAAGLVGPLSDLYRWHLALEGQTPLDARARDAMITPGSNSYAPGWVVGETAGGDVLLQHVGDTEGFQLWTAWLPENDTIILLGINSDIGWRNLASE